MKKTWLIWIVITALLLSACGAAGETNAPTQAPAGSTAEIKAPGKTTEPDGTAAVQTPDCAEEPVSTSAEDGKALDVEAFLRQFLNDNAGASAKELADRMLESPYFTIYTVRQALDYYPGFQYPYQPKGVKEAWSVLSAMGQNGNVFYVLELEEGTDAGKLAEDLKSNVNLNWMYSAPADKTAYLANGSRMLFALWGGELLPAEGPMARTEQEMVEIFRNYRKENPAATALETVDYLLQHQILSAMYTQQVEEGELYGFGRKMTETGMTPAVRIEGFADGALLSPQISPSLFLGYVFILPDGADAEAFMAMLRENGNLGWNVCMVGSTIITEAEGNAILFIMC